MKTDLNIINEPEKITNLLTLLSKTKSYVYLRHGLIEYFGTIEEIQFDQFIFFSDYKLAVEKEVIISFNYRDNYYYFNTEIIQIDKKNITLKVPKEIFIHFKRQFKRYNVKNLDITCNLKLISSVLNNKSLFHQIQYSSIDIEDIYKEIENEKPDFQKIIQLINKNKKNLFDQLTFYIPLDKFKNNIIANYIKAYKKIFLINNTLEERSYFENPDPDLLITYKDYFNLLEKSNKGDADIQKNLQLIIEQYKSNNVFSALYIPMIVMGTVIGVIEVLNFTPSNRLFNPNLVQYFNNIGTLINEAIIKNKLNSIEDDSLIIKVNDMSLSGIGIEFFDKILINYLNINSKLEVTVNLPTQKKVVFIGVVKNIVRAINKYKLGIEIQEILPGNRTRIINFINNTFMSEFEMIK